MRIVLFQPDIAPNVGTILRFSACFGLPVDVVEPCGFPWDAKAMRRAAMDYIDLVDVTRHPTWPAFETARTTNHAESRLILLTTAATTPYVDFAFRPDDMLMVGRESAGVPADVHNAADAEVLIPMQPGLRSVNVAVALAMVTGEALRQTHQFPGETS